jgi:type I restriction-modification system DNA methylase subunit
VELATESGKSKGQFYTPAEVSRILARVVVIDRAKGNGITLYDPVCGSGSPNPRLLMSLYTAKKGKELPPKIYRAWMDTSTAGFQPMM